VKGQVEHIGKVVSMTPQTTTVAFVSHAACSSCKAAGLCGMSEAREKAIQVPTDPYASYGVGDEVMVYLKASMGMKAVYLAYLVPLLVLLAVSLGLIGLGVRDYVAGLSGIGAVALYYLVLSLLKERLSNEYVFTIASKQ
jgi:sigma-E factor negative regulatory protein RseC